MLERLLERVENLTLWIACAALLAMGAIVTASVVGRGAFNAPVPDDLLMIGLLMVCVIILPLAYVQRDDGHIAVTVLSNLMPARLQAFLRAAGGVLFGLFVGTLGVLVARKVPSEFAQGLYYDGQLEIPTWPMKAVLAFGVAVFLLRLALGVARDLGAVFGRAGEGT